MSRRKMQLWHPKRSEDKENSPENEVDDDRTSSDDKEENDENNHKHQKKTRLTMSDFIDTNYWKRIDCCSGVFQGKYGETLINFTGFKPCSRRLAIIRKNSF